MAYDQSSRRTVVTVLIIAAAAVAAGLAWYFWWQEPRETAAPAEVAAPAEPAEDETPRFPLPEPEEVPPAEEEPVLMPLPALADSDEYFEVELGNVLGGGLDEFLTDETLIENFVAAIDNLPRDTIAERIRPVERLPDPFLVDGPDDDEVYVLNPASYERYDLLVELIERSDRDAVMALYQRFYPLFQEAYRNLGYPDAYFNDRVVEVIDHLLETPELEEPVRLVRPHVLYEYEDPELEALSAGQKLMLRLGNEHAAVLRRFLADMRERLTAADAESP